MEISKSKLKEMMNVENNSSHLEKVINEKEEVLGVEKPIVQEEEPVRDENGQEEEEKVPEVKKKLPNKTNIKSVRLGLIGLESGPPKTIKIVATSMLNVEPRQEVRVFPNDLGGLPLSDEAQKGSGSKGSKESNIASFANSKNSMAENSF